MTENTQSQKELLEPTTIYKEDNIVRFGDSSTDVSTSTPEIPCQIIKIEDYSNDLTIVPKNYKSINELINQLSGDEGKRLALEKARKTLANKFYENEGTIRALRLQNGWSQTYFAELLETSQSHVARIERGTDNLMISTCRKLSEVLNIDMNELNKLLSTQENIIAEKLN